MTFLLALEQSIVKEFSLGYWFKKRKQITFMGVHLAARSLGMPSPKKTTLGLRMPPQLSQGGTRNPRPAFCSSTSPSGRTTGISSISSLSDRSRDLPATICAHGQVHLSPRTSIT